MIKDAEQYAEEDACKREVVDAQNRLSHLIHQAEKFAKENEGVSLEDELDTARAAVGNTDLPILKEAIDTLEQTLHATAAEMYQQQPPEPDRSTQDDGVIDAEFEEATPG